jgi:hypothetical protein
MEIIGIELTELELVSLCDFLSENTCEGDSKEIDSAYEKLKAALIK